MDVVSEEGFARFVNETSGVPGLLDERELARIFSELNLSGDGTLDEEEFTMAMRHTLSGAVESSPPPVPRKVPQLNRMVSLMSSGTMLRDAEPNYSNWQILYCGGTAAVVKTIKGMRHELGVAVSIESFDW